MEVEASENISKRGCDWLFSSIATGEFQRHGNVTINAVYEKNLILNRIRSQTGSH